MVKGVDVAVFDVIDARQTRDVRRAASTRSVSPRTACDYVYDEHNRALIPDSVRARVERLQSATSSPGRSSCRAEMSDRRSRRRSHRAGHRAHGHRQVASAPCSRTAARRSRSRAARSTRSSARTAPASRRSCASSSGMYAPDARPHGGERPRRHRLVHRRGDRRGRRHGAPALHARADAHGGRERGARPRAARAARRSTSSARERETVGAGSSKRV